MNISSGLFIKHENWKDVCLLVDRVFDYGHGYEIKATWWSLGFNESYPIGFKISLNIKKNKNEISKAKKIWIGEFLFLSKHNNSESCYRYLTWHRF